MNRALMPEPVKNFVAAALALGPSLPRSIQGGHATIALAEEVLT